MVAPIIAIIAAVLCGALSSIVYALNERTLQNARNRTNRMEAKCDEMAQLIQEIDDTNDALADGLLKLSASFGVSCEDMVQGMNRRIQTMITSGTAEMKEWASPTRQSTSATLPFATSKPYNCPNCGAPVRGGECEYCGTVFEHENELRPYYILEYQGKSVITTPDDSVNGIPRTVRHLNPETHTWEWVEENPAKAVRTPPLPTKHGRW